MTLKITQHHTADHNWLRDGILVESSRLATPVDIGGPYHLGDPAHIQEHNRTTVALQTLADAAGCAVILPPVRKLGDTGHEGDHLAWEQALAQIQVTDGWNDATGGTVTEYSDSRGFRWRAHTFTQSGDLVVKRALRQFRVLVVAGGGGGGNTQGGGGGGAGGYWEQEDLTLEPTTYPVTVGSGGGGYAQGQDSSFATVVTVPGGGHGASGLQNNLYASSGGSGGGGAGYGTNANGGAGGIAPYGNGGGSAAYSQSIAMGGGGGGAGGPGQNQENEFGGGNGGPGRVNTWRDGTSITYAEGGHGSGRDWPAPGPAAPNSGNGGRGNGGAGGSGIVVVAYQVAPYNEATGGEVTEYAKDGKRFRVHTFTQDGTFTVQVAAKPFRVLVAGGGGQCGDGVQERGPGGGGGGGVVETTTQIPVGAQAVTVGGFSQASSVAGVTAGGGGRGANGDTGPAKSRGGSSGSPQNTVGALNSNDSWTGGGGGGAGGNAPNQSGGAEVREPGPGIVSDITGTASTYGAGGYGGKGVPPREMSNGQPGTVIVSYEVGPA